jgi:P27 family predicted phage terminase small subunit
MSGKAGRSGRPKGIGLADVDILTLPAVEQLEKPQFESRDASDLWDEVANSLHTAGKLSVADLAMLRSTCEMWGLYRAAFRVANSNPIDKDARIAVTAYWAKFEQGAARFGLNPSDRQKIKADKPVKPLIAARQRG